MRIAEFVESARAEFLAEAEYYNTAQPGLGARFIAAVERSTALALAFPSAGSPYKSETRRIVVKDFPFALVYKPTPQGIIVFALAHHSRRPRYWVARIQNP